MYTARAWLTMPMRNATLMKTRLYLWRKLLSWLLSEARAKFLLRGRLMLNANMIKSSLSGKNEDRLSYGSWTPQDSKNSWKTKTRSNWRKLRALSQTLLSSIKKHHPTRLLPTKPKKGRWWMKLGLSLSKAFWRGNRFSLSQSQTKQMKKKAGLFLS